jgi:flagellar hook protein FlgE
MDVGGANASTTGPAGLPNTGNPAALQQWYVQKFDIDWGTTSVITQADFDRNADYVNINGSNPSGAGLPNAINEAGANIPNSTGDGQMDGAHTDLSNDQQAGFVSPNVPAGTGAAVGDRIDDLEMPWDPRVVRSSFGQRDGLTQDTTGSFLNGVYTPNFTARLLSQDGYSQGILQSVSVDATGKIVGVYNTQQGDSISQDLAQVAIATFTNPSGLAKVGDTHFAVTANSGNAVIGTALSGDAGSVVSGVVEQSNVDLSEELTNMIVAQRGFEANARMITTSDHILDTLVNLGR